MDNIFNIKIFLNQLSYYLKISLYINKGIDDDELLERCIKIYNKIKKLENEDELDKADDIFIRKTLKRLNLILKIDNDKPIDILDKNNQIKILELEPHDSIKDDNCEEMIEYAERNNINILTNVSLLFVLRESKYQKLLWQYTRYLFYISQIILSKQNDTEIKEKVFNDSIEKVEEILLNIKKIEEGININKILEADSYLNSKLTKSKMSEKNINEAKNGVKDLLSEKGLSNDKTMDKIIGSITNKIPTMDLSKGNIIKNMFEIAQNVSEEVKADMDNLNIEDTLSKVMNIFHETINNNESNNIPPELKNVIGKLNVMKQNSPDENIKQQLEKMINDNGLDKSIINDGIKNGNKLDINEIQTYINKLN